MDTCTCARAHVYTRLCVSVPVYVHENMQLGFRRRDEGDLLRDRNCSVSASALEFTDAVTLSRHETPRCCAPHRRARLGPDIIWRNEIQQVTVYVELPARRRRRQSKTNYPSALVKLPRRRTGPPSIITQRRSRLFP